MVASIALRRVTGKRLFTGIPIGTAGLESDVGNIDFLIFEVSGTAGGSGSITVEFQIQDIDIVSVIIGIAIVAGRITAVPPEAVRIFVNVVHERVGSAVPASSVIGEVLVDGIDSELGIRAMLLQTLS